MTKVEKTWSAFFQKTTHPAHFELDMDIVECDKLTI